MFTWYIPRQNDILCKTRELELSASPLGGCGETQDLGARINFPPHVIAHESIGFLETETDRHSTVELLVSSFLYFCLQDLGNWSPSTSGGHEFLAAGLLQKAPNEAKNSWVRNVSSFEGFPRRENQGAYKVIPHVRLSQLT